MSWAMTRIGKRRTIVGRRLVPSSVSSQSGNKTPNPAEGEAVKSRKRKTPTSNNSSRANSSKNCQKTFNLSASQKDKFFFNLEHEQAKNFNIHEFKTPYWATTEKRRAPIGAFPGTKTLIRPLCIFLLRRRINSLLR